MKWDRTTPCASCPYRRDAPRGLWHRSEFENLLRQDADEMNGAMFGCHEFNKRPPEEHRPCAGWLLDQKRRGVPSIRLRIALSFNKEALACFQAADPAGLDLFDTIPEMAKANIGRRQARKPREYEIFRADLGRGGAPTGLVVVASTKKEAVGLARKKLGRGTWEAHESSPEQRAEQAKRVAEVQRKLDEQARNVPTLVVGEDMSLASEDE